jgi:hypothetical protein
MASDENIQGYRWHHKYSLDCTDVLGKLACLVLLKILGIGSAVRNWEQVKKIKRGDCAQTGIDKTEKQVLIHAQYQMLHGKLHKTALLCADKLWEDTDFDFMKMDAYCKDLQEEAVNANLQKQANPMRKKCEAMAGELGGSKTLWWEGTKTVGSATGEEIYWLEVEQDGR